MYGFSYQGLTQLLAAAEQPEGLVCIAPAMTACDLYHGWFYRQGALRLASSLGWGLQMLKADARRRVFLHQVFNDLAPGLGEVGAVVAPAPQGEHPPVPELIGKRCELALQGAATAVCRVAQAARPRDELPLSGPCRHERVLC